MKNALIVQVLILIQTAFAGTFSGECVDGKDVSLELVKAGFVWHFKRYSKDPVLAEEEERARAAGVGLGGLKDPIPPWEWRRGARPVSRSETKEGLP